MILAKDRGDDKRECVQNYNYLPYSYLYLNIKIQKKKCLREECVKEKEKNKAEIT